MATGYELPRTDAVDLELDGEMEAGQVWYAVSGGAVAPDRPSDQKRCGGVSGIGPYQRHRTCDRYADRIPDLERTRWTFCRSGRNGFLEIKGITESKLEEIKTSYAESRMLQDLFGSALPVQDHAEKRRSKISSVFRASQCGHLEKSPF